MLCRLKYQGWRQLIQLWSSLSQYRPVGGFVCWKNIPELQRSNRNPQVSEIKSSLKNFQAKKFLNENAKDYILYFQIVLYNKTYIFIDFFLQDSADVHMMPHAQHY